MATRRKKSSKPKEQWSVFRVRAKGGKLFFLHGKRVMHKLHAFIFDADTKIVVFRDATIFDTGEVEELGGHNNGTTDFTGLVQIVPLDKRVRYGGGIYFNPILPQWFKVGDIIRISAAANSLRGILDAFPEKWQ